MTTIAWASESWNPIRATESTNASVVGWYCQKVSPGCANCYAEAMNRYRGNRHRYNAAGAEGLDIAIDVAAIMKPVYWAKARKVFVCSMTDLFLEQHTDLMLDRVHVIMAFCRRHTFQVLTKRPERAREYYRELFSGSEFVSDRWDMARRWLIDGLRKPGPGSIGVTPRRRRRFEREKEHIGIIMADSLRQPFPNLWLGVSAEDQTRANERIPLLLETPAAVRWVSFEPALGPIDFTTIGKFRNEDLSALEECVGHVERAKLDWIVPGGESGRGARPFDPQWALDVVGQCRGMDTKVFVKQMGSIIAKRDGYADAKGEDPSEWRPELRVREYPEARA